MGRINNCAFCSGWILKNSDYFGNLLAHLRLRLIGELIGYPWSRIRLSSSVHRSQCSNIFSETAGSIKAKFYVEPPLLGGTKVCLRHPGHMYGKNPSKSSSQEPAGRFLGNLVCSIWDSCPP